MVGEDTPVWNNLAPGLWLIATLAVAIVILVVLRFWYRRRQVSPQQELQQDLIRYQRLYHQGQLSEEEYRRLEEILKERLRRM
ncbi:MAG: hypothetical protein C4297_11070 [Gemmataceae bacterium]